ncbi:SDR family NAD(P)-dependent oxidoreductase [Streptomyces scabiei]|uniref:SDR family NAD(P)-dependent oxidoreductase n=1 Tax=Streptomyces scabiei TaxID=1930 RepID=UPI0029A41F31|nr:SDR family oxidoreductase [Streptomyces scabiei]MDX3524604.1 SDR family oxidoreductase [Streptomyces scabiei]
MNASPLRLFDVEGRTVLITGASGALGGEAARVLTAAGANVVLAGGNADALELLAGELPQGRVTTVHRRPDSPADAEAMVARAVKVFGRLDGVLASAGVNKVAPITDMSVADFETVMDANVRGAWLTRQAVGHRLLEQGEGGSVVLVSSTRGRLGHPAGYSAYSPSKGAVDLLAKSLAAEWGKDGIRVNALAPTVFRSELTAWMYSDDDTGKATRDTMLSRIPLGRLAEPEDFSGALIYLLSDASAFLTGQVLYLDGGYTAC